MTKKTQEYIDLYNEFEAERKSAKTTVIVLTAVYFIIITVLLISICKDDSFSFFDLIFSRNRIWIFISPFAIGSGILIKTRRSLSRKYKSLIVYNTFEQIFDELHFKPDLGVSPNQLERCGLIAFGDDFKCDDYISGKYKGNYIEQCDVRTEKFCGRVMIFEFNKDFIFNLRISEKGFPLRKSNKSEYTEFNQSDKSSTESIAFNNEFDVYSKYDPEAFYLLTPQIMERLIVLKNKTEGRLLLSFSGSNLYVAVNNRQNAFEASIFGKLNIEKERNKVYNDIKLITNFVDELNLDEKIYKTYI